MLISIKYAIFGGWGWEGYFFKGKYSNRHLIALHQCALLYISIKLPWDVEEKI